MCQVLVVIPKGDELRGVGYAFDTEFSQPTGRLARSKKDYYFLELDSRIQGESRAKRLSLVMVVMRDQGNDESQKATREAIDLFDPDIACLCGTAAGLEGKISTGSVLVSDMVFNATQWVVTPRKWAVRRRHQETPRLRPVSLPDRISKDLKTYISEFDTQGWRKQFERTRASLSETSSWPVAEWREDMEVVLRGIAGLNTLHKSPTMLRQLHDDHDYIIAADMEAAGFLTACEGDAQLRQWLVVRGISDYGTQKSKRKTLRVPAACAAGLFLSSFLAEGLVFAHPRSEGAARARRERASCVGWAPALRRIESCQLYPEDRQERFETGPRVGTRPYRIQPPSTYFGSEFASRYAGARLLTMGSKTYPITLEVQNISLPESHVRCHLACESDGQPKRFALPSDVAKIESDLLSIHERMRGTGFARFDELSRLVRCTLVSPEGSGQEAAFLDLEFEVCTYRDYILTNYSAPIQRDGLKSVGVLLDRLCSADHLPAPLGPQLPFANQLGVNAMLITSDSRIPIAERSTKEFTFPGRAGPPVSGTQMYWYVEDRVETSRNGHEHLIPKGPARSYYGATTSDGHGIPSPFQGVLAQAQEELGIERELVKECYLLGINRDLTRGGLPDAFFVMYLDCNLEQLSTLALTARDDWEWDRLPSLDPESLRSQDVEDAIHVFLDDKPASPPLVTNMHLLLQHLQTRERESRQKHESHQD